MIYFLLTNSSKYDTIIEQKMATHLEGGKVMWSQSVDVLNPYEALARSSTEDRKEDEK